MYFENLERPYLVAGGFPSDESWIFFTPFGEVTIGGCNDALRILLPLCTGENKLSQIVEILAENFSHEEVKQLLESLAGYLILVDANSIFYSFYAYSRNPSLFCTGITRDQAHALIEDTSYVPKPKGKLFFSTANRSTSFQQLLEKRKTVRTFSGENMTQDAIMGLMWSMYGKQKARDNIEQYFQKVTFNVPSGGALYPLFNYLFLFLKCGELIPGLYLWHKELSSLELIKEDIFQDQLSEIVTGIDGLVGSTGLVCTVADFQRSAQKYGNKAYNLIQSEVGHVMQNAYLFCTENEIGIAEVAGYHDEELAKLLGIKFPLKAPLAVAVFGKES